MYEYDIAISFADNDRKLAYKLATLLNNKYKLKVFYDDYEQAKLIGKNLTEYLIDIYKNKSRYCVVLVSKSYKEKRWSQHEWRAAQARAFEEPDITYIIPVRLDDTELPGLLTTVSFLPLKRLTISKIANIIFTVVKSEVEKLNIIRVAQEYYANAKFKKALNLVNDVVFDDNIEALRIRGNANAKLFRYKKAIKSFEKISKLLPNDFLAHFHLGIYYYRIGNFEKSVPEYEAAKKIYPHHPTIQSDLPAARKRRKLQRLKATKSHKKLK